MGKRMENMCRLGTLLGLLCLMGLAAACSLGGQFPDPCDANGSLLYDDFSGAQECGWRVYNQGGAVAEIDAEAGTLQISTSEPGSFRWTVPGRDFDDVIVTTQARQAGGPDNNAYGVICRYQNEDNYYVFLISGDGYYAIGKYQTGDPQITYLTGEEGYGYVFSDVINQGMGTNQLRAGCVGNELSLTVNGIPLVTVADPTFVRGDVGMGVGVLEPGTAVVQFDDFQVIAP
ncbi:MAG: hypothetical protein GY796_26190 [Chloroflexi bacterium]|nr:hypothetical protein [Chloroflexota bacterium]